MAIYDRVVEKIISKADEDLEFRRELIRNPKETISKEFKVDIPADVEIDIVEDTQKKFTLVLPNNEDSSENFYW